MDTAGERLKFQEQVVENCFSQLKQRLTDSVNGRMLYLSHTEKLIWNVNVLVNAGVG